MATDGRGPLVACWAPALDYIAQSSICIHIHLLPVPVRLRGTDEKTNIAVALSYPLTKLDAPPHLFYIHYWWKKREKGERERERERESVRPIYTYIHTYTQKRKKDRTKLPGSHKESSKSSKSSQDKDKTRHIYLPLPKIRF